MDMSKHSIVGVTLKLVKDGLIYLYDPLSQTDDNLGSINIDLERNL